MNMLNGAPVIARTEDALYVRIPEELQVTADGPHCECERVGCTSKWDTLVVPTKAGDFCWTVHMPDPEWTMREWGRMKSNA